MAIKRFDANKYVQIYGAVKGESTFLRFDLFGCQTREQFKNLNFGVDWPEFQINELTQEE
jgi:hypothetical protein